MGKKIHRDETIIEQLSYEIAILKRHKFAKRSEQINPAQGKAIEAVCSASTPDETRRKPKRVLALIEN